MLTHSPWQILQARWKFLRLTSTLTALTSADEGPVRREKDPCLYPAAPRD